MSERSRQRRLSVENRLEELAAKHGPLERLGEETGLDLPPSWGPVGSLLRRLNPDAYEYVLRLHREMLALERSRLPAPPKKAASTKPIVKKEPPRAPAPPTTPVHVA